MRRAKDTRKQRDMLATFVVAGLGAVFLEHLLGPQLRARIGSKGRR